jgi:predicted dehydrogenase
MANTPLPRRDFLRRAALAGFVAGFPTLIPASALGKDGAVAPSNRIQVAGVGLLGMGQTDLSWLISQKGVQVVAVCDVDTQGLDKGTQLVKGKGQAAPNRYQDFREMLAKEKLDAASIAVPDHWHAAISIPFLKAGVDVYGEKPLAKTLTEGRAMVDAVKAHGRVWQTGMWQRSTNNFRRAALGRARAQWRHRQGQARRGRHRVVQPPGARRQARARARPSRLRPLGRPLRLDGP